jgi:serine/threonine-protein kinase RsbW
MAPVSQMTARSEAAIEDDVVLLTVPAEVGYLGVLRTATAGLAARLHFALDEIEDLRIAVDEGCSALIEAGIDSPLLLSFEVDAGAVVVLGSTDAGSDPDRDAERMSLSDQILRVVTDEHELAASHGRATFRFTKRSRASSHAV